MQRGETLGIIALIYGISVKEILEANELFPPYSLVEWQALCIPRIAFERLYPKASLNARVFLNKISIWGVCFPNQYLYKVKIRALPAGDWNFVGNLFVAPDGSFEAHFQLPQSLSNENRFQVCLKEQNRDYNTCFTVDNRWISGQRMKWNGTWITLPSK